MMQKLFCATFTLFIITGLSGCVSGARYVNDDKTSRSGVVAIPENSNVWPTYYRDGAYQLIREQYPNFNPQTDIVSQSEVKVGEKTQNDQRTDRRFIGGENKPIKGEIDQTVTSTSTSDKTEWRIQYRLQQAQAGIRPANNAVLQAGGIPKPIAAPYAPLPTTGQGLPVGGGPLSLDARPVQQPSYGVLQPLSGTPSSAPSAYPTAGGSR